jgi:hypothetical protein
LFEKVSKSTLIASVLLQAPVLRLHCLNWPSQQYKDSAMLLVVMVPDEATKVDEVHDHGIKSWFERWWKCALQIPRKAKP